MSLELLYLNGEPVHAGDRVQHRGDYGRIVFVTDGDSYEASPGYDDYVGSDRGVVICNDDGALTFLSEPTEDLELIGRA